MARKAKEISKDQQIIEILKRGIGNAQERFKEYEQEVKDAAKNLANDPDNERLFSDLCCAVSRYSNSSSSMWLIKRDVYCNLLEQLIYKGIITDDEEG